MPSTSSTASKPVFNYAAAAAKSKAQPAGNAGTSNSNGTGAGVNGVAAVNGVPAAGGKNGAPAVPQGSGAAAGPGTAPNAAPRSAVSIPKPPASAARAGESSLPFPFHAIGFLTFPLFFVTFSSSCRRHQLWLGRNAVLFACPATFWPTKQARHVWHRRCNWLFGRWRGRRRQEGGRCDWRCWLHCAGRRRRGGN